MRFTLLIGTALLAAPLCSPASEFDSDGDGVPNLRDLCPNTPYQRVNRRGCPLAEPEAPAKAPASETPPSTPRTTAIPKRVAPRPRREQAAQSAQPAAATPQAAKTAPANTASPVSPRPPTAAPNSNHSEPPPPLSIDDSSSVTVYFAAGDSMLSGNARRVLDSVAARLSGNKFEQLTVLGYTSDTGDLLEDLPLAQSRAKIIARALAIRGIDPARVETANAGKYPSVEHPADQAARLRAQRAVLRFHRGDY